MSEENDNEEINKIITENPELEKKLTKLIYGMHSLLEDVNSKREEGTIPFGTLSLSIVCQETKKVFH